MLYRRAGYDPEDVECARAAVADVLYNFEAQFREKRALWRMFELAPLRYELANGRVFRWFGVNIPFSLIGAEGDLDLLLALRDLPGRKPVRIYETFELKTTLISRDGRASSLKAGHSKTRQLLGQLAKYRQVGSPSVSLMDIYICESGFFGRSNSMPGEVMNAIRKKLDVLKPYDYGYSILVMEFDTRAETSSNPERYFGLRTLSSGGYAGSPIFHLNPPRRTADGSPFADLVQRIEEFVEREIARGDTQLGRCIVTYCRQCRTLIVVDHKREYRCRKCGDALALQMS
jgi:hypothetical protein